MKWEQEQLVMAIAMGLLALFAVLLPDFGTWGNLMALLRNISILGIFALCMALVMIGRGIDLSQVAIALVAGGLAGKLIIAGLSLPLALSAGLCIAVLLGFINGMIISYLRVPPLFATLATALLFVGVVREWVFKSMLMTIPPEENTFLSLGQNYLGIPVPLIVFILSALSLHGFLAHTSPGRFIYAHGNNPDTARLTGIPVQRLLVLQYVLCAVFAYLAGLLMIATTALVDLKAVQTTLIFDVIMLAILGGVSLSGGRGKVLSVLAGALLIGVLLNAMTIMDINYQLQNIIKGTVLLIVIVLDTRLHPRDEENNQPGI